MSAAKLVLVDGSYYLFRAFYALGNFRNPADEPIGAIYGVINMLKKLIAEETPDYFAVVFDPKGRTFRNDLYPEYKGHRPPIPEDLAAQIKPLQNIIRAQGIPLLVIDGVEADDVIATLATLGSEQGMRTVISSGDKDLAQMVTPGITLLNTMDNARLDPQGVKDKFGVAPERIVDYLALVGDSVDNVPGVPRVGPKTAVKWLREYGSLEKIMAQADQIKGKVGESLRASLDKIPLSRELVTLKTDVELPVAIHDLVIGEPDIGTLEGEYRRWQLRSWLEALATPAKTAAPDPPARPGYETIFSRQHLDRWLAKLRGAELIAFDTETTSLDYMDAEIVGVSFAIEANSAAYVPLAHDYPGAPEQLPREEVLALLKPLLEDPATPVLGHNLKYDLNVLANHDVHLSGIRHDSMLQSYVLDSTASRHDMDSLAGKYLGVSTTHYEDVAGKGAKQLPFNHVPVAEAAPYAAEDADITLRLHQILWPRLSSDPGLRSVYETIELPLLPVIAKMERNGVRVDPEMLRQQSLELGNRLRDIEELAYEEAGQKFNIGSPKQIQSILFEKMALPVASKTPKGQPSTSESVLQELAEDFELPRLILQHRGLSKLKSTYTDKLPQQINPRTGRIHTSYHQAVAATGRLSSSDPNLQNIPVRSEAGRKIRRAFVAGTDTLLLAADYSQIELRIMAHLSEDSTLIEAFAANQDIHRATAAEVFSVAPERVSNEQRRAAKAINFGLIYGMSPFGLAKQLGIDRGAAREYVDRYFARYPGVRAYMDRIRSAAKDNGYVETVFKRRLYLPEINSRNAARRQYAERTAINAPMQGTAADIIKRAMILIDSQVLNRFADTRMIMQVHDELVFEVPRQSLAAVRAPIEECMTSAAHLLVPLQVDIGSGRNWDEAH